MLIEYEKASFGRELTEKERNYKPIPLFVNKDDKLMLINDFATLTNLKEMIREVVYKERKEALRKTGKEKAVVLSFQYDRGSSYECISEIERIVLELSEEIKASLITTEADTADPDKRYPVLLNVVDTRNYGALSQKEPEYISGVTIAIMVADKQTQILKDFTLDELENSLPKPGETYLINLHTEPNVEMGVLTDIKEILSKAAQVAR
mgnify:CR=1 FL=1